MDLRLEEIGLTPGEIRVYLALVEKSPMGKSELSVKAKVSSSKVYEIAEKLVEKGLVGQIKRNGTLYYQVHGANRLRNFIEEREKKIRAEKEIVERAIPLIEKMKDKGAEHRFEVFEGKEGMRQVITETFQEMGKDDEMCGFGIELKDIDVLHDFHRKRVSKNINQRFIFSDRNIPWTDYEGKKTRFIEGITNIGIGITGKKVILMSYDKTPVTLVIEHPEFNKSFQQIFDKLWGMAKK